MFVPNFESFGGFDPIGFKLLEGGLGGAPAGDGDKHDRLVEIVAMLPDDLAKSAPEKIPGDGFSCLFGSDEAQTGGRESPLLRVSQGRDTFRRQIGPRSERFETRPIGAYAVFGSAS